MANMFPIRMNYGSPRFPVDVYAFTIKDDSTAVALCWDVNGKEWRVVHVRFLIPIQSKQLND